MDEAGNRTTVYFQGSDAELDARLLEAHACNDIAALINLYTAAGDRREAANDVDGMCFYLTHAYIFSLETGAPEADDLNRRLFEHGREVRQRF